MIGRVYRWAGAYWMVLARGEPFDRGPRRNVLLEAAWPGHLDGFRHVTDIDGRPWSLNGVRTVRPFRGLRRATQGFRCV